MSDTTEIAGTLAGLKALDEETIDALRAALAEAQAERDSLAFRLESALRARNLWTKDSDIGERALKVAAKLDRALAFARKAGHLPWCDRLTMQQGWAGPCTCGLAELGVE